MKNVITFSKALADPTRWRIIRLVMDHALCVCELADILEMPQSSVSSHVQIIRKAGLLESEKCEKWTYFQIHPEYRTLVLSISRFFQGQDDLIHLNDTAHAVRRLSQRESSCCPGPKILTMKKLNIALAFPCFSLRTPDSRPIISGLIQPRPPGLLITPRHAGYEHATAIHDGGMGGIGTRAGHERPEPCHWMSLAR